MALGEILLAGLAARDDVEIGLGTDGVELDLPGYARQPAVRWAVDADGAHAAVTFGPMARATFSEALLFVGGQLRRAIPFAGGDEVRLPAGQLYGYTATVTADG